MAEQFDNSDITQEENMSELRREVSLTSALLVEVVSDDDKFTQKLKSLNDSGVALIQQEEYQMALVYFQEAEKILEYAASCGKTIDRSIIISTLQNQACVYQRLWELEKASNYLEAIIFNMNAYIECAPDLSIDSQIFDAASTSHSELSIFVRKRLTMAFFYLQFSAVSSQIKKHDTALGSAFKALSVLKMVCEQCYNYEKYTRRSDKSPESTRTILKELSSLKETVELDKMDKYLALAKRGISRLRTRSHEDKALEQVANFAIGEVMQISPISMEALTLQPKMRDEVSYLQKIYKSIYISICFFTIATELRLIANESYLDHEIEGSAEFRKSQLYHLNAVIIASKYVPCSTIYIDHIIKSFQIHYNIDLLLDDFSQVEQTRYSQLETGDSIGNEAGVNGLSNGFSICLRKKEEESIESPGVKENLSKNDTASTKVQTFHSEKSIQNHRSPSYELKKKKKHQVKQANDHKREKSSSSGHPLDIFTVGIASKHQQNFINANRKSSINKKGSCDKLKFVLPSYNKSKRTSRDQRLKDKDKSRDKSKSHSKNKISIERNYLKDKSMEKVKKKNTKLSEQYFMKPGNKKKNTPKLRTAVSSKSVKKNRGEYLGCPGAANLGSSGVVNVPGESSPHGNTFIGMKGSAIKSPKKIKF